MNQPLPDLHRAKRNHERVVEGVRNFILEYREVFALPAVEGYMQQFEETANEVRCFHANAANAKSFEKVVNKFLQQWGDELRRLQLLELFKLRTLAAHQSYREIAELVAADKARKAEKRAKLAARAQQKQELGVDLEKVDERATPETYRAIFAQLEPVRQHYVLQAVERLHKQAQAQAQRVNVRDIYRRGAIDWHFFTGGDFLSGNRYQLRADLNEYVAKRAEQEATDIVASFAAKLAGKIDREKAEGATVAEAAISSNDLWNHSTLVVRLSDGSEQRWETTMIVNQSCLGKLFNQWPTRRVL